MKITVKDIATTAMVAAMYFIVTYLTQSFAYMDIQFRIAEIFLLLVFYNRKYIGGVTLGCFLANLMSPLGLPDVVFGTLATLLSAILIGYSKNILVAIIWPVLINSIVVGLELYFIESLPFWITALQVGLGEAAVMIVGVILFMMLRNNAGFMRAIDANQNIAIPIEVKEEEDEETD